MKPGETLAMLSALTIGMGSQMMGGHVHEAKGDTLIGVDIDAEYELIKQKKSGLCKRLRDQVVYEWNRKHQKDS